MKRFLHILAAIGLVLITALFAFPYADAMLVRPGTEGFTRSAPSTVGLTTGVLLEDGSFILFEDGSFILQE